MNITPNRGSCPTSPSAATTASPSNYSYGKKSNKEGDDTSFNKDKDYNNNNSNNSNNSNLGINRPPNVIVRDTAIPAVHRYVPADFDFGYNLLPSSVDYGGVPLRMCTIRSGKANWTTTTISIDHADITVKNGEMFLLLSDYFSLYFQDVMYGHPGVAAYEQLPADLKPSGGVDTRVFLSRPHFNIFEGTYTAKDEVLTVVWRKGSILYQLLTLFYFFLLFSSYIALI